MKISIALFVFFSLLINGAVYSQPYYYTGFDKQAYDEYGKYTLSDIFRINLSSPSNVDTIFRDFEGVGAVLEDETNNWIVFDSYHFLILKNLNSTIEQDTISFNNQGVMRFNSLLSLNRLFVYYFDGNTFESMITFNPNDISIRDTIPENVYNRSRDFILSKDGSYLYLNTSDSLSKVRQIWRYSLSAHQITIKKNINDIVLPGSEKWYLYFRRNGLAVVESYYSMNDPFNYYKVYFLDNDSLSIPIKYLNPANAYPVNDGKYLMMFQLKMGTDSSHSNPTGKIDIYDMTTGEMKKTIQLPPEGEVMCFENYPNNVYYVKDIELPTRQVWNLDMDSIFNVLDLTSLNPNSVNVSSNSFTLSVNGKGFDTLSTVYFNGQQKTATFISDSVLTAEILSSDVSAVGSFPVWVKDRYSISDTLQFNVTQASNPNLVVNLKNSLGTQIPASNVKYYEESWRDAVNNGDGTFTVITTRPTVSIRVFYEYASQQVDNVPAQNNTYTFTTVNAAVQLKNSIGNLIDAGTVQYYAGAWRTFGTTTNGIANKELLPINYSFRMTYEYGSIDKQQNLSTDPTVIFQTVNAAVQLKNSLGSMIDAGTVQYYAGAWRSFGTTSNGVAYKELLPVNYSFRMTYEFVSNDKQLNISTNPVVDFNTVLCSVKVSKTSDNQPINNADVKYYSGAWRNLGTTNSYGITTKELLPANLSFRATSGNVSLDKQQDISVNNLVEILLNIP